MLSSGFYFFDKHRKMAENTENYGNNNLIAISGIVKRFIIKNNSPYAPLTKKETLEKLAKSRKQAEEGKVRDAKEASDEIREKYGL